MEGLAQYAEEDGRTAMKEMVSPLASPLCNGASPTHRQQAELVRLAEESKPMVSPRWLPPAASSPTCNEQEAGSSATTGATEQPTQAVAGDLESGLTSKSTSWERLEMDGVPTYLPTPLRRTHFSRLNRIIPVHIKLQNLSFTVKDPSTKKGRVVLKDINLSFSPGQLVGIMGPSGCGKTTLLRTLHGNPKYAKHVEGDMLVNNTPVKNIHRVFRRICCLVPQEDVLLPTFSVWDTIMYAAHLRLVTSNRAEKAAVAERVLDELGLQDCRNTKVRRISGGQKRRVSIGLELLVDPSILLLDEATSGLDSKSTEDLCALLASLAGPGRCVITSIHQPAYKIFLSFDRICFMTQGRVAFDGPATQVKDFFERLGYETPYYENPADYYIRVVKEEPDKVLEGWHIYTWSEALMSKKEQGSLTNGKARPRSSGSQQQQGLELDSKAGWLYDHPIDANSSLWEFGILLCRMMQDALQDPIKLLTAIAIEAAVGVLLGLGWFQLPIFTNRSIFPVMGVMIMLTTIGLADACLAVCLRFPEIRALHFREFSNGYYQLVSYFAASVVSGSILCSISGLVQGLTVYFMVGFELSVDKLINYLVIIVLTACTGSAIGFLVGVVTSEIKMMHAYLTAVLMPMMVYSGYMLPYPMIPQYLRWVYDISIYAYIYNALVVNHFRDLSFHDCAPANNPYCTHTGDVVLRMSHLSADHLPRYMGLIVAFFAVTCALAFAVLRIKSP